MFNFRGCLDSEAATGARTLLANEEKKAAATVFYENLLNSDRRRHVAHLTIANYVFVAFSTVWQALKFSENEGDIGFLPIFTANTVLQCTLGAACIVNVTKAYIETLLPKQN